jgi:DNA primase
MVDPSSDLMSSRNRWRDMKGEETPTKYLLRFNLSVEGIVEENDVIGAIFGQTEGLFGPIFDLREMQKTGRVGRIIVKASQRDGMTEGTISIFCGLDMPSTTLLSALVESVDQIGPYKATIKLDGIVDYRREKVDKIVKRAKDILDNWKIEAIPEAEELLEKLRRYATPPPVYSIGKERIPAGPDVIKADEVILVEGRADVNNLMKYGIKNVLSIEGGKVPHSINKFLKGKKVIAFLDADRGGDLNLKKLLQLVKVDYIAQSPPGKEVEELKPEEIFEALRNKRPVEAPSIPPREELKEYSDLIQRVNGALEALLIDGKGDVVESLPVSSLVNRLEEVQPGEVDKIIFDGIVTQRLLDIAEKKNISLIIGNREGDIARRPMNLHILTFGEG